MTISLKTNTPVNVFSPLSIIATEMEAVDAVINERLRSDIPMINGVLNYLFSTPGKRLRPSVLLLTSGALGFRGIQKYNLAAVVEFIHAATLIHDDVVDESNMRRGNPTANETFGNAASVLVGDFLYSRAFQIMVEAKDLRILSALAEATNVIAEGEVLQLMNIHNAALTTEEYLSVIRSKTAKLFEASARVGALVAQASPLQEQLCADYGQAIGVAYQIIDDILDYEGDPEKTGKNVGDDLREGKTTLPLILAMEQSSAEDKQLIQTAIEGGHIDLLPEVLEIIYKTGSLDLAHEIAGQEGVKAKLAAQNLPVNDYTKSMVIIAQELLQRKK